MGAERPRSFEYADHGASAGPEVEPTAPADHGVDHVLKAGETVHFTDVSRHTHAPDVAAARASHSRGRLRGALDRGEFEFQANAANESHRQKRRERQLRDRRADRRRDTVVHRAGQRAIDIAAPRGSKRRTAAATAAVTATAGAGLFAMGEAGHSDVQGIHEYDRTHLGAGREAGNAPTAEAPDQDEPAQQG